jgi:hypothetical protein
MSRRWLNDVTDSHDPRVHFIWIDRLEEEAMKARRHEVQRVRILCARLEIGHELECLVVERQRPEDNREISNLWA